MLYIVTDKTTNNEITRYSAMAPTEASGYSLTDYEHTPYSPEEPVLQPSKIIWDALDFLKRFTDTERKAIWALEASGSLDIVDAWKQITVAPSIHSDDPDVIRILTMLEAGGILANGRTAEILSGI